MILMHKKIKWQTDKDQILVKGQSVNKCACKWLCLVYFMANIHELKPTIVVSSEHSPWPVFNRLHGECQDGHCHRCDIFQRSVPVWPVLQQGTSQQPPGLVAKTGETLSAASAVCFYHVVKALVILYMMPAHRKALSSTKTWHFISFRVFKFLTV